MEVIRGHVYALYPTAEQDVLLSQTAGVCRLVYNLALEQRRTCGPRTYAGKRRALMSPIRNRARREADLAAGGDGMELKTVPTSAMSLSDELSELRRAFDFIGAVSQTAQNQALVDLDRAFANFFEGRAGYPRPRRKWQDDGFRQAGREVAVRRLNGKWSDVRIPKIGWIRFRDTRPIGLGRDKDGHDVMDIRSATLSRRPGGGWQISIAAKVHIEDPGLPQAAAIGIDRGVAIPLAGSDGSAWHLPDTIRKRARTIKRASRQLSRKRRGSHRYKRARARMAKLKGRDAAARRHLAHVASRQIADRYGLVALEALKITGMTASARGTVEAPGRNVAQKAGLNRVILNVGWHGFETLLAYKLEERGGILVKVPAAYTSQTCAACGHVDPESRESQALFCCTACGASANADLNAARNILARALAGETTERRNSRRNTPALDVEGKASAPCEASTHTLRDRLDAVA